MRPCPTETKEELEMENLVEKEDLKSSFSDISANYSSLIESSLYQSKITLGSGVSIEPRVLSHYATGGKSKNEEGILIHVTASSFASALHDFSSLATCTPASAPHNYKDLCNNEKLLNLDEMFPIPGSDMIYNDRDVRILFATWYCVNESGLT